MTENIDNIVPVKRLTGHTSMDTAFVQDDYPYGRELRCQRRVWIDTATKGAKNGQQRFVYQTTNPKLVGLADPWSRPNKPHAGQYHPLVLLFLDENDHVGHWGVSGSGVGPESDARFRLRGLYDQLVDAEKVFYDALVKVSRRYSPEAWDRLDGLVDAFKAHMREHDGRVPQRDSNGVWTTPNGQRHHIYDYELPTYVTLARQALAKEGEHDPDDVADIVAHDLAASASILGRPADVVTTVVWSEK